MNTPLIALRSVLGLAGLWAFVFYFWRDYRIDTFREHVFSIRDRLFLYVADGDLGFDNAAYKILRQRMNVVLRYAHEFTMSRFLFFLVFRPRTAPIETSAFDEAVLAVPSERDRNTLREFNTILAFAIFQFIIYRSFFLYVCLRPIVGLSQVWLHIDFREAFKRRPQVPDSVQRLESEAMEDAQREELQTVGVT